MPNLVLFLLNISVRHNLSISAKRNVSKFLSSKTRDLGFFAVRPIFTTSVFTIFPTPISVSQVRCNTGTWGLAGAGGDRGIEVQLYSFLTYVLAVSGMRSVRAVMFPGVRKQK